MDDRSGAQSSYQPGPPPRSLDPELERDLHATIAALRELGPGYEQELVNSFLDRLDKRIAARGYRPASPPPVARFHRQRRSRFRGFAFGAAALFAVLFFTHGASFHDRGFPALRSHSSVAAPIRIAPVQPSVPVAPAPPPAPPAPTF